MKWNKLNRWSALFFIVVVGTIARVVGINFGLPQAFHPDEPVLVLATRQFFSGDFNPHNFLYPSFLMYLMHFVQRIYYIFSPGEIELSTLYILSRLTVAAFGVATTLLTFVLGKKMFGVTVGVLSALVVALVPLHVINSHLATTDVPLTFFILLTLIATMRLAHEASWKNYILTGMLFGLTVSTKIPGVTIFLTILVAHFYRISIDEQVNFWHQIRSVSMLMRTIHLLISLLVALAVFWLFSHFQIVANVLMNSFHMDLWAKFYDKIIARAGALRVKFSLISFIGVFALLDTMTVWRIKFIKIFSLVLIALLFFSLTTPYAILDYKNFFSDFFNQIVVSQTSWGGMFYNSPPGIVLNLGYLLSNFGWILILALVPGLIDFVRRASVERSLFLVTFLVYFLYISSWKINFDRYMVPVIPFVAVISVVGLQRVAAWLTGLLPFRTARSRVGTILLILFLVLPVISLSRNSFDYDRYLLKKNTRTIAFQWGIKNLPKDARILTENYAPQFEVAGFDVLNVRADFKDLVDEKFVREHHIDYIVVTSKLWDRKMLKDGQLVAPEAYRHIEEYADLIKEIKPGNEHPGPVVHFYRVRTLQENE